MAHWSDCPVNNAPALPVGPCNCGNDAPVAVPASYCFSDEMLERYPEGRKVDLFVAPDEDCA